jgi:hypothetical protein
VKIHPYYKDGVGWVIGVYRQGSQLLHPANEQELLQVIALFNQWQDSVQTTARVLLANEAERSKLVGEYASAVARAERAEAALNSIREAIPFPNITSGTADSIAYQVEIGRQSFGSVTSEAVAVWLRDLAKRLAQLQPCYDAAQSPPPSKDCTQSVAPAYTSAV